MAAVELSLLKHFGFEVTLLNFTTGTSLLGFRFLLLVPGFSAFSSTTLQDNIFFNTYDITVKGKILKNLSHLSLCLPFYLSIYLADMYYREHNKMINKKMLKQKNI